MKDLARTTGLLLLFSILFACATPAKRIDDKAAELGFVRSVVQGIEFSHVIYRNNVNIESGPLHVYLAGDGLPWATRHIISQDPTPRRPVTLTLMAPDKAASIYVARPCYHGLATQSPCSPEDWTHARYSEEIVNSMAAALRNAIKLHNFSEIIFIGFSGGGTLAMLLAERFPQTGKIITIAGNLDPDAWTEHHGYSKLSHSLNPAHRPPLDANIFQLHLVGENDSKVPPALIRAAVAQQANTHITEISNFDHSCCWQNIWPLVLDSLDDEDFIESWNNNYRNFKKE